MPTLCRDSRQRRPLLPRLRTGVRRQRGPPDLYRAGSSPGGACCRACSDRHATQHDHGVDFGLGPALSTGHNSTNALSSSAEADSPAGRGQTNRNSRGRRQNLLPLPRRGQTCRSPPYFEAKNPRASAGGRTNADFAPASWGRKSVSTQAPAVAQAEAWPRDLCPLCQAPLRPDQNWCLRCGAAARTRLAAQPKWKALVVVLLLVVLLSLGVLAAALVKLAG